MRRHDTTRPNPFSRKGSITVLVLVFVVLLTFIVVAFLEEATSKIKYYGLFHNRDDLRTDAYSALEISLAVVNQYREIEGALWGPAQGWSNPFEEVEFEPRHAGSVSVSFSDESAKLGLSALGYDDLIVLFEVLGYDLPDSEALADGLLDWTDEDDLRRLNGFDGEDYEDMNPPYHPPNSAIQSWDEFRLIQPFNTLFFDEEGRPLPEWRLFKNAISLYHNGSPNVNQASDLVLEYLEEKGEIDMRSLRFYRNGSDGIPGTEDDRLLRSGTEGIIPEEGGNLSTEISLLHVKVQAIRGDARFEIDALVTWSGSDAGAGEASNPGDITEGTEGNIDTNRQSAADRRQRARGETRTAPSVTAELGYPFRFVRLTENRSF